MARARLDEIAREKGVVTDRIERLVRGRGAPSGQKRQDFTRRWRPGGRNAFLSSSAAIRSERTCLNLANLPAAHLPRSDRARELPWSCRDLQHPREPLNLDDLADTARRREPPAPVRSRSSSRAPPGACRSAAMAPLVPPRVPPKHRPSWRFPPSAPQLISSVDTVNRRRLRARRPAHRIAAIFTRRRTSPSFDHCCEACEVKLIESDRCDYHVCTASRHWAYPRP